MDDRIQRALDGELPREGLSAAERAEVHAHEEAADAALAGLRTEAAPDVAGDVMRRVAALPRHGRPARAPGWQRTLAWLWAPRPVRVRPAWGLAAAMVASLLVVGPWKGEEALLAPLPADATATVTAAGPTTPRVFVHFRLDAAEAQSVRLAADFTGWEPRYTLNESAPGVWTLVVPVEPGVHQYAFLVDGQRWVADPLAPTVDDGFGGTNSRLDVMVPEPLNGTAL